MVKISLWSPSPTLKILLGKMTCLNGIIAIVIPSGPPVNTFKVLNLRDQQWSGLQEETKVRGLLFRGYFSQPIAQFDTLPPIIIILLVLLEDVLCELCL